jgi:hypothetical protein
MAPGGAYWRIVRLGFVGSSAGGHSRGRRQGKYEVFGGMVDARGNNAAVSAVVRGLLLFFAVSGSSAAEPAAAQPPAAPAASSPADVGHNSADTGVGWQSVPDILKSIVAPQFPARKFVVTDFGAEAGGKIKCTEAFRDAIAACERAGGGRVEVPRGQFLTGPIHLKSNVELHLAAGSEIIFSDVIEDYLPPVFVRVGGIEVFNYSPLVYARDCKNIAVTGPGKLNGNAKAWWAWKGSETKEHFNVGAAGTPVESRVFAERKWRIRPSFLSFVDCENVLLEDFTIGSGPNWTIHPIYCENVTIRGVTVRTDGPNNDGIDPDSCRNMLIEECVFDTGDDCIVLKSGYNQDGWRVAKPTENVIVRNCRCSRGHGGLVIGSEMSGGVRNVFMEDCQFEGTDRAIRIKSRADRGGVVEHVFARNVDCKQLEYEVILLTMDYTADPSAVTTPAPPVFRNMLFENIRCQGVPVAIQIQGMQDSRIRDIEFRDMEIAADKGVVASHVERLKFENVRVVPKKAPVYNLTDAIDVSIAGATPQPKVSPFMVLSGESSSGVVVHSDGASSDDLAIQFNGGATAAAVQIK